MSHLTPCTSRLAPRSFLGNVAFVGTAAVFLAFAYSEWAEPFNSVLCALTVTLAQPMLRVVAPGYSFFAPTGQLQYMGFGIEVSGLCSGLRGLCLWSAALLWLPGHGLSKLLRWGAGGALLVLLNALRVVHLLYVGATQPSFFRIAHEWLWPLAIAGAVLGYRWVAASRGPVPQAQDAGDTAIETGRHATRSKQA